MDYPELDRTDTFTNMFFHAERWMERARKAEARVAELEKPVSDEPVAWMHSDGLTISVKNLSHLDDFAKTAWKICNPTPLYLRPAPKREPMTEDAILDTWETTRRTGKVFAPAMSEELKPCPFCDSNNTQVVLFGGPPLGESAFVQCLDCSSCGPNGKDQDEAITVWNRGSMDELAYYKNIVLKSEARQRDAEDAARIDWLERAGDVSFSIVVDAPHDGEFSLYTDVTSHDTMYGKTLREAIDAAMSAGEKHE